MGGPLLDDDEGHQQHGGYGEQGEGDRGAPAVGAGLGEAVDEGQQAAGDGRRAGEVVAVVGRGPALRDVAEGGHGGRDGDGHVDEQRPAPGGELGQHAAQDEADGGAAAGDAAVDGEGPGPLLGLGEGHREQRQGGGRHDGGEGTLQGAGAEEHGRVLGQAAEGGGAGEADEADHEHPLAPEVVGDAAAEEQQAGEGEGVGGQHPLAVGGRDVQGPLGRGQGDDHHRGVEHHHELGHRDDGQRPEALGVEVRPGSGRLVRAVEGRGHGVSVSWKARIRSARRCLRRPHLGKGLVSAARMAYNRNRSFGST